MAEHERDLITPNPAVPAKKELSAEQIAYRQIRGMSDRQVSNRLNRIANKSVHNIDAVWAIVLREVFNNTKPFGRMEPYLK
jgi:hypothetical protein